MSGLFGGKPFDPSKMRGPEPAGPPTRAPGVPPDAIGVSDLASMIDRTLRSGFEKRVRVVGEISGFNDRTHWYFSLKDEGAVVSCVMFASAARRVGLTPENGQSVLATGRVEFYARQGRVQLYVESIEPIGAGRLEAQYRALCEELRGLGWFAAERKRPLPRFPRRIAIVTSRTSAALQDVIDTVRRRCPGVALALIDVTVQGDGAAPSIVRALGYLSAHHGALGIDAIILTRGGGSIEDLWAFNDRAVAQAVLECAIPVVAAIGHETDTTIAELVADERAATPTQAAMRLTPDRVALHEQLDQMGARLRGVLARQLRHDGARVLSIARRPFFADPRTLLRSRARETDGAERRLAHATRHQLSRQRVRLERLGARLARNRPEALYSARRARVDRLADRMRHALGVRMGAFDSERAERELERSISRAMRARVERLDALERELIVVGPQHVLARGYSVTTDAGGRVVRAAGDVRSGQVIRTRVADGAFHSTVGGGDDAGSDRRSEGAPALPPRRRPRAGSRRHRDDPDQLGLF